MYQYIIIILSYRVVLFKSPLSMDSLSFVSLQNFYSFSSPTLSQYLITPFKKICLRSCSVNFSCLKFLFSILYKLSFRKEYIFKIEMLFTSFTCPSLSSIFFVLFSSRYIPFISSLSITKYSGDGYRRVSIDAVDVVDNHTNCY